MTGGNVMQGKGERGTQVPEIRFGGFSEEWEEKKMLDCTSRIGDGLHGTPQYGDGTGVYFINGNNLVSGKILITEETKQVNQKDLSKEDHNLSFNTILLSINGTIGNLAWYQGENVMLGKSVAYINLSNCDSTYIYFYLQTQKIYSYFLNNLTGSTIKNLGLKAIREARVLLPQNKNEQTKIGDFFQQLDRLISQHQQKHDKLLNIKKALLEKMFPQPGKTEPEVRFKGFSGEWEETTIGEIADTTIGEFIIKTKQNPNSLYPVFNGGRSYTGFYDEYNNEGNTADSLSMWHSSNNE